MHPMSTIIVVYTLLLLAPLSRAQDNPLQPPDRSSPRAALQTFLRSADDLGEMIATDYRPHPSSQRFARVADLLESASQALDLSEVPAAARTRRAANTMALYEVLSRIPLPPLDQVPGPDDVKSLPGDPPRWTIPGTSITLIRASSGPQSGDFLFSAHTVARAESWYARVRHLPYQRSVPLQQMYDSTMMGGGWMIPYSVVEAMPAWMRQTTAGLPLWKWLALAALLLVLLLGWRLALRTSRRFGDDRPALQALARLCLPIYMLIATLVGLYLALAQINLRGQVGTAAELAGSALLYTSAAWICWRMASLVAEMIIASPRIKPRSIDAHLIRVCTRLLGIMAAVTLLVAGADRIGMPVVGIIAGLGVGGLAIALAAQPSIENLIGGLNLFADKPLRVGDTCKYGGEIVTVEEIGLRSTRLRGLDRTVTTVPNAELSRIAIINLAERERMLLRATIGVRYETAPDQLRQLLAKVREMLLAHPAIDPNPARVRFIGFGASSLDIEIYAYVLTRDTLEFLRVQEDVFLRVMDLVSGYSAGFAFPSQTVYLTHGMSSGPTPVSARSTTQPASAARLCDDLGNPIPAC